MEWRKIVLQSLHERNKKQCDAFVGLIQAHNKLFESAEGHHHANVKLTVELEQLKKENLELMVKVESGGGGGQGDKNMAQKLLTLQEELTEFHKRKGENSQQIIELNNALQEKEKELQAKVQKIQDLEIQIQQLNEANENMEQNLIEATTGNQVLIDEQQALQLAFTSLEGKFRKMQEENNELVSRWLALKSRDADKMNEENDIVQELKSLKMQKELAEAAREPLKTVPLPKDTFGGLGTPTVCSFVVTVPSRALNTLEAHDGEVHAVRWSPSGKMFATGGSDRKVKLWQAVGSKCEPKGVLAGSNAAVMSVEFDMEETLLLAASNDFACRIWSLPGLRLQHTLTGHSGKVLAAKFLGEPNMVVSGSHDRTLKLWDLRNKTCIKTLFAGSKCNDLMTSDTYGTTIISGHFNKKLMFWDPRVDTCTQDILMGGQITSLDFSPDGMSLLSCTRDDAISVIDLRSNRVMKTLRADGFHLGCDWSRAVFSPDGEYVMAGSGDGAVFIWNVAKSKVEKVLREHTHAVTACSWSITGSSLLSCDRQRTVVLWADF
ncbi:Autophagy-related protein 16-1 [Lamellibrachia satsuma]|nr:Autophagy-related protein 16-1 [Lamellibrachia satsuma]